MKYIILEPQHRVRFADEISSHISEQIPDDQLSKEAHTFCFKKHPFKVNLGLAGTLVDSFNANGHMEMQIDDANVDQCKDVMKLLSIPEFTGYKILDQLPEAESRISYNEAKKKFLNVIKNNPALKNLSKYILDIGVQYICGASGADRLPNEHMTYEYIAKGIAAAYENGRPLFKNHQDIKRAIEAAYSNEDNKRPRP